MALVKQISIKDPNSAHGYDTRDIGAKAINIEVEYDADGHIVNDPDTQTVDPSKTKSLSDLLGNQSLASHADPTSKYGAASKDMYGHVKLGAGLDATDGEAHVVFGSDAGTAVEGNDPRIAGDRKNPYSLGFADGTRYDGSEFVAMDAAKAGAAPESHAESTGKHGIGSQTNYGHVRVSDIYDTSLGTAAAGLTASQDALYKVYEIARRGSGSAGLEITKAEYDALEVKEKDTIYFISDWDAGSGGGGGNANVIALSRESYEELPDEAKNMEGILYLISDEGTILHKGEAYGASDAKHVSYTPFENFEEYEPSEDGVDNVEDALNDLTYGARMALGYIQSLENDFKGLATVATTGSYKDLIDPPNYADVGADQVGAAAAAEIAAKNYTDTELGKVTTRVSTLESDVSGIKGDIINDINTITDSTPANKIAGAQVINELKKSVADGKAIVANAISGKGVNTATSASFDTLAANAEKLYDKGISDVKNNPSAYGFPENMIVKIGTATTSVNVKTWCDSNSKYNIDYTKLTNNNFIIMNKSSSLKQTGDSSLYVYVDDDLGKMEMSVDSTESSVPSYNLSTYEVKPSNNLTKFRAKVKSGSSGDSKTGYLEITYKYDFYILYNSSNLKS